MLLGFGRGKKEKDYTELRRTQVDGFKRAFPTAKAVTSDDSAFDIAIPSASATAFLRVILPPNFPEAPPAYKLYGVAVRHPWVDVAGTVANHPRLHPWDPNNSVAEIAQQIIAEVNRHVGGSPTVHPGFNYPPGASAGGVTGYPGQAIPYQPSGAVPYTQARPSGGAQQQQPPPYSGAAPPGYYASQPQPPQYAGGAVASTGAGSSGGEARKERPPINLPAVPSSFSEVAGLPIEELNRLLTDEVAFSMLLVKLQQVKDCKQMLENARASNAALAKSNLSQGDELTKMRTEVTQLREVIGEMKKNFEGKLRAQQGDQPVSLSESINLLRQHMSDAASAAEEKSEDIASSFKAGDIKIAEFLPDFLKLRTEYHERLAKLELLEGLASGNAKK